MDTRMDMQEIVTEIFLENAVSLAGDAEADSLMTCEEVFPEVDELRIFQSGIGRLQNFSRALQMASIFSSGTSGSHSA